MPTSSSPAAAAAASGGSGKSLHVGAVLRGSKQFLHGRTPIEFTITEAIRYELFIIIHAHTRARMHAHIWSQTCASAYNKCTTSSLMSIFFFYSTPAEFGWRGKEKLYWSGTIKRKSCINRGTAAIPLSFPEKVTYLLYPFWWFVVCVFMWRWVHACEI